MYPSKNLLTYTRILFIFILFIIFWLLPAFAMHFIVIEKTPFQFTDLGDINVFINSLLIAVLSIGIALFCGLLSAYYIAYSRFRLRKILMLLLLFPLSFPPFINAIAWLHISNYSIQSNSFTAIICAGVLFGLSYFPIIAILSSIGFFQLDKRYEEAARLHFKDRTVFMKISVPLASPFILSGIILVFLFVVLDYGVADFFGVRTYSIEIFTKFALHDLKGAVVATYPLLVLTLFLAIGESILTKGKSYIPKSSTWEGGYKKPSHFAPFFIGFLILISGGLPLFSLLSMAGGVPNYISTLKSSIPSIYNSLLFAFLSAGVITTFGFFWAHFIGGVKKGRMFLNGISNINLALPGGLIAISLIFMWNHSFSTWIYNTIIIVILCNFARFSPIAYKAILAPFLNINRSLKELTEIATNSYSLKMSRIFFPLSHRGLLFGFMLAFLFSFRELEATLLILPPGKETLPIRIFSLIHYGAYENVAVLCLLLVITGFILSVTVLGLISKCR